jgi:hypothetical protein
MDAEAEGAHPSARADLYGGLFWIVLGTAIAIGSWNMDRLENLGVSYFTAPGLVPGVLGLLLIVCGVVLALRALADGALGAERMPPLLLHAGTLRRAGLTLLLCVGFAAGLVGHGIPFWFTAALFMFVAITALRLIDQGALAAQGVAERSVARLAASSLFIAIMASALISGLFQELFLVRLP